MCMSQDSVPVGSYNDPFLSSVCVCVFNQQQWGFTSEHGDLVPARRQSVSWLLQPSEKTGIWWIQHAKLSQICCQKNKTLKFISMLFFMFP